jgi:hypothetical protein
MRPHPNPFRSRSTEQQRDVRSFLRNFGAGVLELLPETLWGPPVGYPERSRWREDVFDEALYR